MTFRTLALGGILTLLASSAFALEKPKGEVILTVTGAIAQTNAPGSAQFDEAMLKALQARTTTTETPWTQGKTRFHGPLLRAVLEAVGAKGQTLKVVALNDYSADIPADDAARHDVILATTLNGKPMSVRDKGPIFVIYPFDSEPDLYTEIYFSRSVWQVTRIDVQ